MPRLLPLALVALAVLATRPATAQDRSFALSFAPIETQRAMSSRDVGRAVAGNLRFQYDGDRSTRARVVVITGQGDQVTSTWISDLFDLLPGEVRNASGGPRPLPWPTDPTFPDLPDGGGAALSTWLGWLCFWCETESTVDYEDAGERAYREYQERQKRRQTPDLHNDLQSGPPPGPNATTILIAVIPEAQDGDAEPPQSRVIALSFPGSN